MSAPTGNFRGQRTQSSCNGFKTIGSSIASGNNGGCFKRIYANSYQRFNGDSNLALTYSLKIPKSYYNSISNSSNYQQPTLSGQRLPIKTDPNALTLTQVYQTATASTSCPTGCYVLQQYTEYWNMPRYSSNTYSGYEVWIPNTSGTLVSPVNQPTCVKVNSDQILYLKNGVEIGINVILNGGVVMVQGSSGGLPGGYCQAQPTPSGFSSPIMYNIQNPPIASPN
jgi:hypothetical protein